jgi:hypothetical protein
MIRPLVASALLFACFMTGISRAQREPPAPTEITIRPAKAPVPALKYRLLPESRDQVPGNAAVFYHRAIEMILESRGYEHIQSTKVKPSPKAPRSDDQTIFGWVSGPLRNIPRDEARQALERFRAALHEVELGALRRNCDWELDRPDAGFDLRLPEIQQVRALGRLVALQVRLNVLDGRIEEAIHWLQVGCAMARHVAQAPLYIPYLVGSAVSTQMVGILEDLIQNPAAPNLYWAVANLPRPLLDPVAAHEGEQYVLEREFPRLRTLENGPWTLENARSFTDDLEKKMAMITGDWARVSSSMAQPQMKDLGQHLVFAALVARAYPEAKRRLLAEGKPAAEIEAMPAIQVVALYSYRLYQEARDDIFKWTGLPYSEGYKGLREANQHPRETWAKLKGGIPFASLLPAINSVYVVPVRLQRRFCVVQYVEAIRLYAADHEGALPASLEAITEVPLPVDPATGKPLTYKLDGSTATLSAPGPPGWEGIPQFRIDYVLKLAR